MFRQRAAASFQRQSTQLRAVLGGSSNTQPLIINNKQPIISLTHDKQNGTLNMDRATFRSRAGENREDQQNGYRDQFGLFALTLGLSAAGYSQLTHAEEQDKSNSEQNKEGFLPKLDIPRLIQERETEKQEEYKQRTKVDLHTILNKEEVKEMQLGDQESAYLTNTEGQSLSTSKGVGDQEDDDDDFDLGEQASGYGGASQAAKPVAGLTPQQYRSVTLGPENLLVEGQMVQIAISDPFNKLVFYPTDNIILMKHAGKHYVTGSYCGYCFTNLATGALLGEKLVCPSCMSAYNIVNGTVEQGPTMRNISSFEVATRDKQIKVTVPEHIPAFSKTKYLGEEKIDPRTIVVLGDSQEALAAVDSIRQCFTGQVILFPVSQYGQFENPDVLKKKFTPLTMNESFIVEQDFLDKANVAVVREGVKKIDWKKNELYFKKGVDKIKYDKLLVAWGSHKKRLAQEFSNVHYLEDKISHQRCSEAIGKAKTVVILGGTLDAYQVAATAREHLDMIGKQDSQVILISESKTEVEKNYGGAVSSAIHQLMKKKRISIITNCDLNLKGDTKLDTIYFTKQEDKTPEKLYSKEGAIDRTDQNKLTFPFYDSTRY